MSNQNALLRKWYVTVQRRNPTELIFGDIVDAYSEREALFNAIGNTVHIMPLSDYTFRISPVDE